MAKAKELAVDPRIERSGLVRKVESLVERARKIIIRDNPSYESAAEFLKTIKGLRAEVDAAHDPVIAHWHGKHKESLAEKKKDETPLAEAERIVKSHVAAYLREQETERLREESRIRLEIEERIRVQAIEGNLRRAQELTDQGRYEEAAEAVDAAVEIPEMLVKVESTVIKVDGISLRKNYSARVVDVLELAKAVASGVAPVEALQANQVFLNQQARAYKKEGLLYPGVKIVADDNVAAGQW